MTRLLALDPGKTTGFWYGEYSQTEPLSPLLFGTIAGGADGFVEWFLDPPLNLLDGDEIVCELFVIDGTITGSWSPRIEGALLALTHPLIQQNSDDIPITWQTRGDKAALLPTEARRKKWLKDRDLWTGNIHSADALAHALVLMKRKNHLPTLNRYWR